jgi:DNA-binding CsgD family transcriptional regulator
MGVFHAVFLVDLVALCLGVGIIFVALLSWERSGIRWLRDLSFVLAGASILLMLDILRIYEIATGWPPNLAGRFVLAALCGVGNLVLVVAVPLFVQGITPYQLSSVGRVIGLIGIVLLPLAGVLDEMFNAAAFHILNDLGIALLLAIAAVLLAMGYRKITEPETRRMVIRMMWLTIATIVLGRAQLLVTGFLGIELELRRVRVVQVLYYFGLLIVVLVYAVKHLFRPLGALDFVLPQEFVDQYRISNRERDIITMIVQGYANRIIGERLFISDRTVKNHVSSIYRKTGAVNKVQLLNMVRNHPGSRIDPRTLTSPAASGISTRKRM